MGKCYCNRSCTDKHYYGPRSTEWYNQTRHKGPLSDIYNLEFQNTQPVSKNKNINTNHKQVSVENFKNILSLTDWNDVLGKTITNESYDQFIKKFSLIYDDCFPIKVIEIKTKNLLSP